MEDLLSCDGVTMDSVGGATPDSWAPPTMSLTHPTRFTNELQTKSYNVVKFERPPYFQMHFPSTVHV